MSKQKLSPLTQRLLAVAAPPPPEAVTPGTPDGKPETAGKRTKLWELADKHHCPVIGTCIPLEDLVRFARRFHFKSSLREEFALHVEMVGYSHTRNEISEALQRHLDRKYQRQLELFGKLKTDTQVRQEWKNGLSRGEVAGALWAAYTHKAAGEETRQTVYADIHMLSHQVGAGQAADSRRLAHLEKENIELKRTLRQLEQQSHGQISTLQKENVQLELQLAASYRLKAECETLRQRLAAFESGEVMADLERKLQDLKVVNEQHSTLSQRTWDLEKTLKAAQDEAQRFARERDEAVSERNALERLLNVVADSESLCSGSGGEDCGVCEQALSANCILYVGGRASMISQYRQLANRLGIRLIHHDGGLEESLSRLPDLIQGADAVVCPTDNISHSAYYQVKSHCKRVGKPCLFYKGTGVSSFAVAMTRISRGEYSLGREMSCAG